MHILHDDMNSAAMGSLADRRREETLSEITRNARRLADEHGLDGFTMEDLAAAVGVSRRTLFNYVPGKIDAVLGPEMPIDPQLLETFTSGGPTGHLMVDLREFTSSQLATGGAAMDDASVIRRLLHDEPRLVEVIRQRIMIALDQIEEAVIAREGDGFDRARSKIVTRLMIAIVAIALDEYIDDSDEPLALRFTRVFDTVMDLFD